MRGAVLGHRDIESLDATGSITAIATTPLRLRIDITTANAGGETIRLAGDAGVSYHKVTALCS